MGAFRADRLLDEGRPACCCEALSGAFMHDAGLSGFGQAPARLAVVIDAYYPLLPRDRLFNRVDAVDADVL